MNTLTAEQTRIRIAELMGWKGPYQNEWLRERGYEGEDVYDFCGMNPQGERDSLPDFSSLDACAEFEATLTEDEQKKYVRELSEEVGAEDWFCNGDVLGENPSNFFALITAKPLQRCAAFLRVKEGK